MKWSFVFIITIVISLLAIIIISFNKITVSNEQDSYNNNENISTESIDITYFRLTGEIKTNQEKIYS